MKLAGVSSYRNLTRSFRKRRFSDFLAFIEDLPRPVHVLDMGGKQCFWESMQFVDPAEVHVTLLNIESQATSLPNFAAITADGTNAAMLGDRQFDVVFSNSVIEHCPHPDGQRAMAREIQRLGGRYWVQTPNYWFPIEPHCLFPFFHWLPVVVRAGLLRFFQLGHYNRRGDFRSAVSLAGSVRLLSAKELRDLFPGGILWRERMLGLTKSLVVREHC